MIVSEKVQQILDQAQDGKAPSQQECALLLSFPECSSEAALMRATADAIARRRFENSGILLGQIGVEIAACPGSCKFCSFGDGHTAFAPSRMRDEEILACAADLTASGDLYALLLMTTHEFDFARLIHIVGLVRAQIPAKTQIVVNIGDFDRDQAHELKATGVTGAYHVCRLREGIDTALEPESRMATVRIIKECGLDWYNCCEPVGPEHTPEELAEQIYLGIEHGCFQHAAMRRVYMPSSPLAAHGQVTELRLAQVVAAVTLATLDCPATRSIAVHEPNLLGLTAGANTVYAETRANPRDTEEDTTGHRGQDIGECKKMLYEAGFQNLLVAPEERRSLRESYR